MSERMVEKTARPDHAQESGAHSRAERTEPQQTSPVGALIQALGNRGFGRFVQARLSVGRPGDRFEQEADRVADQVLRAPDPAAPSEAAGVQVRNVCGDGGGGLQRQEAGDGPLPEPDEDERLMQAKEGPGPVTAGPGLEAQVGALRGGGEPLPAAARSFFEPRFGNDFSGVRLHTGAAAGSVARDAGALAFTVGRDIVFAPGRFAPDTESGRHLLAHELTHVVQQGRAPAVASASAPPEVSRSGVALQRQPAPQSAAQLHDPVAWTEPPDFDFYNVQGTDFTALPVPEGDVRQVLIDTGVVDAKTIGECTVSVFHTRGGDDRSYFAYAHPTLGVVARAYAGLGGRTVDGKKETTYYNVFAFLSEQQAQKYLNVSAKNVSRAPTPSLDAISGTAPASFADLYAGLRLIEARLAALAKRYPPTDRVLGGSIVWAQAGLPAFRARLVASPAQAQAVETALQLLEWVDYDLTLLEKQRETLVSSNAPTVSLDLVRERYGAVIQKILEPDVMDVYGTAQRWAERLPIDALLDALRAHGELNKQYLTASATLVDWADDLRKKVDALYDKRQQLAAKPGDPALTKEVETRAAFLEPAVRGVQLYAERLVAFEQFIKNRPGVLDTPLIDAMNRLRDRVDAIKAAYDANDAKTLKERVDALENDAQVKAFYHALPAAMRVTQMVARIGVATLASLATGGVAGLLTGGARAVATGITVRAALTFAGTAVLEAATFTAVNATASTFLFGDKISFGSLLKDFAWNVGLFAVLRSVSGVSSVVLRAAELEVLTSPVQLTTGFSSAYGYGVLRFRVEQGRWPTGAELDRMTAEAVILLAGTAVGSKGVQRWLEARNKATSLSLLYKEYGWRFDALETLRSELGERVKKAEAAGKGNDPAEVDAAKAQAQTLEKKFQELLDAVLKDKRFQIPKIRAELLALRESGPSVAAELLATALGIPLDVGIRRAAKASYTYSNAKTGVLESALSGKYTVTKSTDPATGLKTVTATSPKAPTLLFQERTAAALDFDPGVYDVQKLSLEYSITSAGAQRQLWRLLSENGLARDAKQATTTTRAQLKALMKGETRTADEVLSGLHNIGRLRASSPQDLVQAADRLAGSDILKSNEWLEAREDNQRGVVGEWLAREAAPPAAGSRVLRRVTVQADLYEDAAGAVVAKDSKGQPLSNATAAETDLLYVRDVSGTFEVDTLVNVKASGEKGMAKSANLQNANFESILGTKAGDLAKIKLASGVVRYARVKTISALDGTTLVDLTGKLKPSGSLAKETVGPKGAQGFSKPLTADPSGISTITKLLNEKQLIGSGEY